MMDLARPAFRLRTAMLALTLIAAALGVWARGRYLRRQAAEHHFQALDAGYEAAVTQRPIISLEWEWKFPSPVRMDRQAIEGALPSWRRSMHHAKLRDAYLAASRRPWLPCFIDETFAAGSPAPKDNAILEDWWQAEVGDYVDGNRYLLETAMSFGPDEQRAIELTTELLTPDQYQELAERFSVRRGAPNWGRSGFNLPGAGP